MWFQLECFHLMLPTVVQHQCHFRHLFSQMYLSLFVLHQEFQFLLCFPSLHSFWRNHWVNKLFNSFLCWLCNHFSSEARHWFSNKTKYLVTDQIILWPIKWVCNPNWHESRLTSILTFFLELTDSLIVSFQSGAGIFCWWLWPTVLLFWIYLFLLTLVFVLQWLSIHWEILIMWLSKFLLTF